jgi:acyl carrier protein
MVSEIPMDTQILKRVQGILVRQLDICASLATPNARLREDLGADALDLVELVMAIGCEFGDDILDEDFRDVHTLGELVDYIEEKCAGARQLVHSKN